ncbi:MAG: hypothetical protein VW257_01875 [Quisquiliibacterium sp.]
MTTAGDSLRAIGHVSRMACVRQGRDFSLTSWLSGRVCAGLALCALLGLPLQAQSAGAMNTDEARVIDQKSCQLETWVRRGQDSTESWILPACSVGHDIELAVGGSYLSGPSGSANSDVLVQLKRVLAPVKNGGSGWAISAGYLAHPGAYSPRRYLGDAYANLLNSYVSADGTRELHANLGWTHDRAGAADRLTWGVATQIQQTGQLSWLAELYGRDQGRPWFQVGARISIVPDRVQIDATMGSRFGSGREDRWVSLVLRLLWPDVLP